jgi:transcription antitermination factor NusG
VSIDYGPLAGVQGVIVRAEDGKTRVVVSIDMLFRSVAAEIERDWISRVEDDRRQASATRVICV